MASFDPRIISVGLQIDGGLTTFDGLAVTSSGSKTDNSVMNDCTVTIYNLDTVTRDYILTETSLLKKSRTPKQIILDAGRESTGLVRVVIGDIIGSAISQPPDIGLQLKALTGSWFNGQIISRYNSGNVPVSEIAQKVSEDLGVSLNFQATDKNVADYSHNGAAIKQIDKLGSMGNFNAYLDDDQLVVKDRGAPLHGSIYAVNAQNGMIGIPEVTQFGVKVKFLLDTRVRVGDQIIVESTLNRAANGSYVIYKLSWEIANRDTQFYYIAEANKLGGFDL